MPHKCCVPGCRSNYRGQEYVSVFTFPSDADVKEKWLELIGRRDYVVSKNSVVCARHFQPHFIVTVDSVGRDDGTLLCVPRTKPKLQNDALPTIFPLSLSSSAELPKKRKAVKNNNDNEGTNGLKISQQKCLIKDSVASFHALCKEIEGHIHQQQRKSSLAVTSMGGNTDTCQFPVRGGVAEAEYVTQKFEFLEQQRKYMHLFTDHFIDKMIREGRSWVRQSVVDRPGFAEMCLSLDKAVEFLCLMCEELSGTWEVTDKMLTHPELGHASLVLPGLAPRKASLLTLASANISRRQALTLCQETGIFSCPYCCVVFSHHDGLCSHMDRAHSWSIKGGRGSGRESSSDGAGRDTTCRKWSRNREQKSGSNKTEKGTRRHQKGASATIVKAIESRCHCRVDQCPEPFTQEEKQEKFIKDENSKRKIDVASHGINLRQRTSLRRSAVCTIKKSNVHSAEKPFRCNICGAEFKNRDRLLGHERKHKGENPFQCSLCDARFDRTCRLRAHASVHTGVKPFHCEICGSGFTLNSTLQIHMRKHTGETPYLCNDCGASFENRRKLKIHRIKHTGEKPYKCDVCGAGFNQTYNLQIHKRKHTGEKPYTCDICGMGFADSSNLKVHKNRHEGEDPHRCDVCGVGFSHNVGLQIHRSKHRADKPHKCDTCGLRFSVKSSLQNHKGKHTGEKPYRCDVCGVRFYAKTSLLNHKRKHTGEKPYRCSICGIQFYLHTSLLNHTMKHTGEKPYECEFCGIKFSLNSSLQNHRRKHTGEKPYLCDICGTEFAHSGSLRDHKRLHTGEKPYKCGLCGADFSNRKKLQRHRKVHSDASFYTCSIPGVEFSQSAILHLGI